MMVKELSGKELEVVTGGQNEPPMTIKPPIIFEPLKGLADDPDPQVN